MKVELTAREIRLLASALQKEVVRLAHRERQPGLDKEYETLWNKFSHLEESSRLTLSQRHSEAFGHPDSLSIRGVGGNLLTIRKTGNI